jgi:TetR/AcrR family transcriptional regulator, cholesterol catabolism regulator
MVSPSTAGPQPSRRACFCRSRRQRILDAAAALMAERGYAATTMEDIADAADVSKGTVFNYFASKAAIAGELYDGLAREFVALVEHPGEAGVEEALERIFVHAEALMRRGRLMGVMYEQVFREPLLTRRDNQVEERVLAGYRDLLRRGQARGEVRGDVDCALGARLIVDLWSATLQGWVGAGMRPPLAPALMEKIRLVLRGLGGRAGEDAAGGRAEGSGAG